MSQTSTRPSFLSLVCAGGTRLSWLTCAAFALMLAPAVAQQRLNLPAPPAGSPVWGGVPDAQAPAGAPRTLTLLDALRLALEHNLSVITAEEAAGRASGTRRLALAELLPSIDGGVTETRRKTNLEAFGFPLGPTFPRVVGPFNVFDARLTLKQALFDRRALSIFDAETHQVTAAQLGRRSARDLVVLVAATVYLETVASGARASSARAQLETAQALHRQAQELRNAGVVAGIDVVRAEVRLREQESATIAAQNDFEKAKLRLARLIGLPLRQEFTLTEETPDLPVSASSFEDVLAKAYAARPEFLAAQARVRAAEAMVRAARAERWPTASLVGDYGAIGLTPSTALSTFAITGAVTVPLFDGGRIRGRTIQAESDLNVRKAELEDLRGAIYYNTRSSFLDLAAAEEQLKAATTARDLAALQLTQARDRFAAGVTSNLEVVQAQEAVAAAAEHFIAARYDVTIAQALVLSAPGSLEEAIVKYLGSPTR
jgi:outer membrane protein TolC